MKSKKPLNILLLGLSGSGKGTQAKMLAEKYNLKHLQTGETLRNIIKGGSEFGVQIAEIIDRGKFVPYQWVVKISKDEIAKLDEDQGVVLDGFVRKLPEAKAIYETLAEYNRILDYVFLIDIGDEEAVERLSKRRICKKCCRLFIAGVTINKNETKCPDCGGEIYRRSDDTLEGIKKRLSEFKKETTPVIEFFKERGDLIIINGEQSVEEVFGEIVNCIK